MILKIYFTHPTKNVPVNNQTQMNGYFHKVLGENNKWHDAFSDYAISSLQGGKYKDGFLEFDSNPYVIISTNDYNEEFLYTLVTNLPESDASAFGMKFMSYSFDDYNVSRYYDKIYTISPILLKKKRRKITIEDDDFIEVLTEQCKSKLKYNMDIIDDSFRIEIRNPEKSKVKKIMVGDTFNKCSMVSLIVYGKENTRKALYNLGIGNSTGCGFGSIKIAETYSH